MLCVRVHRGTQSQAACVLWPCFWHSFLNGTTTTPLLWHGSLHTCSCLMCSCLSCNFGKVAGESSDSCVVERERRSLGQTHTFCLLYKLGSDFAPSSKQLYQHYAFFFPPLVIIFCKMEIVILTHLPGGLPAHSCCEPGRGHSQHKMMDKTLGTILKTLQTHLSMWEVPLGLIYVNIK